MAQQKKKQDESATIRISAKESKPAKVTKATPAATDSPKRRHPLVAISDYFKGAWYELRQVRWPSRTSTWGLTLAILLYTAFFVLLIVLLDAGFKLLFERILG